MEVIDAIMRHKQQAGTVLLVLWFLRLLYSEGITRWVVAPLVEEAMYTLMEQNMQFGEANGAEVQDQPTERPEFKEGWLSSINTSKLLQFLLSLFQQKESWFVPMYYLMEWPACFQNQSPLPVHPDIGSIFPESNLQDFLQMN